MFSFSFFFFFRYCWIELREWFCFSHTWNTSLGEWKLHMLCITIQTRGEKTVFHSLFFHFICFKINWFLCRLFYHSPEKMPRFMMRNRAEALFIEYYISWWSIRTLHLNSNSIRSGYQFSCAWIIHWNCFLWILKNISLCERVWISRFNHEKSWKPQTVFSIHVDCNKVGVVEGIEMEVMQSEA